MTHHFGEPDPERPGSLFEKPTPTSAPAAPRDADEVSPDAAAAADGGRADDARGAAEPVVGGAPGSEVRAADEGRDARGAASRSADDLRDVPANEVRATAALEAGGPAADFGRDEPGTGGIGAAPVGGGAAADPPTTAWDRPSADAARDERGAGAAGGDIADRPAPAWERAAADDVRDVPVAVGRAADAARDERGAGAAGGDVVDRPAPAWERAADDDARDVPRAGGRAADDVRDERGAGAAGAAALGGVRADRLAPGGKPQGADDQATAAVPAVRDPVDGQAPGRNRSAVDPFATAPMQATPSGGPRPFPHPQPAGDRVPAHTLVDDAPTEALPVVEPAAADAVPEWRPSKQTSRLTTILIIALLVAVGFLAGVFVGRAAAPAPTGGEQPQPAAARSAESGGHR